MQFLDFVEGGFLTEAAPIAAAVYPIADEQASDLVIHVGDVILNGVVEQEIGLYGAVTEFVEVFLIHSAVDPKLAEQLLECLVDLQPTVVKIEA
ncbi:hypothetical protein [Stenotrophomonas rhizophila]